MTDRRKKLRAKRDRAFLARVIKARLIHKDELTDEEMHQVQRLQRAGCLSRHLLNWAGIRYESISKVTFAKTTIDIRLDLRPCDRPEDDILVTP